MNPGRKAESGKRKAEAAPAFSEGLSRVLAAGLAGFLFTGCTTVGVHEQRLVSKPNMQFSRLTIYSYDSRVLSQVQPGRESSGGAQASSCTLCR